MKRLLISSRSFGAIATTGLDILKRSGFEILRIPPEQRPLIADKLRQIVTREDPHVILCGAEPLDRDLMARAKSLELIMKHGVGVDNIDIEAATQRGILVANAPGTNTEAVADLAVALMLVLVRGICKASSSTKKGSWDRFIGHEIGELTVGVVGTGRIGSRVIEKLQGFAPRIVAFDVVAGDRLMEQFHVKYVSLDELLALSDIVTLHAPLMDQTRMMIGDRELKLMKKDAYLVNVARGELVDEAALYRQLACGALAGAALDVFATEPPQDSPLLSLDNVLATPHIAAYTFESMDRMGRACAETIVDVMAGKAHENVLNPQVEKKR
jgi:D-3-phosphoglycerate dehydrogenase